MTGILPTIVTLLLITTGPLVDSVSGSADGRPPKENLIKRILPIGFFGRWGEGRVERDMWFQKNSNALLLCRISRLHMILESHPEANITWLKNDMPVENKRAFITPGGHLNITKFVRRRRSAPETDEGIYRCLLVLKKEIEYMVSAPPITVHVAEFSRHVSVSANNITVVKGTSFRVSCKAPSQPPALLHWQKNQFDLPHDDRIYQPTSGVLQITNVQDADGGIYRCVAYNELMNKTKYSEDVAVVVASPPQPSSTSLYIPPSFLYPTTNITLKLIEGWRAILECSASGLPTPTITWQRKGILAKEEDPWELVEEDHEKRAFLSSGHLMLEYVSVEDAGRYSCTASSQDPAGKIVSISQEYKVMVIVEPHIANSPRNITTLMAKTVRLNCSLQDPAVRLVPPGTDSSFYFPAPRIAWYKNGIPVQLDTRIEVREDNQLVFLNSGTSDTAVYQCLATNEAGYATAWSYLLVNSSQDHPPPPKSLQVVLLSATSALLTWSQESNPHSPVVGYSIHLTEHGPHPYESQVVSQVTSHIFEHLKPNTNYSFHVRAYSTLASDPSETVNFTTREAVPIAAPEFLLEVKSSTSILVTWSPLPSDKARGTVEGYKIQWQRRKKDYYNLFEVGPEIFQHLLENLHPTRTYKVRVLGRTKAGYNEGIDWPWKSITLPEVDFENPSLVMHLKVKKGSAGDAGSLQIEVTWQRHKTDFAITGYTLTFKKGEDPWSEPIILPPTANSYIIPNIERDWYKVKLSTTTDEGEGSTTVQIIFTGDTAPPEMPTLKILQLVPKTQTSVQVIWETHRVENKSVSFYQVKQEYMNNGETVVSYHNSTSESTTIENLILFKTYQLAVRAHISENVYGPYSDSIQFEVPLTPAKNNTSSPPAVTLEVKNFSTIEVIWSSGGNPSAKFEIAYSRNKTLPMKEWTHAEVNGSLRSFEISGLDSNTEYWLRMRSCQKDCGPYSEAYTILIPSDSSNIYLVAGLAVSVVVLLLGIVLAIYLFKFRMKNPRPIITSNANGSVGGSHGDGRGHHPGGRNGVSDLNGREGDYIPMLNRIHTEIPTTPLDTKGGYNNSRVNGFTNSKCNGVVRGKELHCGSNSHPRRDESEERECLFPSSRDRDILSRAPPAEDASAEDENAGDVPCSRSKSLLPPITQMYNDREDGSRP